MEVEKVTVESTKMMRARSVDVLTWKPCWDDTGQRANSSKALEGDTFKRSKEKKQKEAEKAASLLQLTQQSLREQDNMVNGEIKEETGQSRWTECLC